MSGVPHDVHKGLCPARGDGPAVLLEPTLMTRVWEEAPSRVAVWLLGLFLLALTGAAFAESRPDERVTKDRKGRVTSRETTIAGGARLRTRLEYDLDSLRPSLVIAEEHTASGRLTRRTEQRLDGEGRIRLKTEIRIDETGKGTGTRTRYSYDASGRALEESAPAE